MRKITSLTIFISFMVLILNSIVLYVVPEGRVAYWADWRWLGLSKSQWGEQHTVIGFLFVAACILHLFYNWKAIFSYMKNKAREFKMFTRPFNISLLIVALSVVGTYYQIPPFSTVNDLSSFIKDQASKTYGKPPYGHAELSSLKMLCQKEAIDLNQAQQLLKAAGISFTDEKETIISIAKNNHKTPQQIWLIIKEAKTGPASASSFPDSPKEGWGKLSLADVCTDYHLDLQTILLGLANKGIQATEQDKVKVIAENNGINPMQLFETLHGIVEKR